jgi:hypothetical protein
MSTTTDIAPAVALLHAVPASKVHTRRLGVDYVYQADECGRKWYGATTEDLADLAARLERGDDDAYSLWCAERGGADPLPYIATDLDGGNEETFATSSMDDAEYLARRWVEEQDGDGEGVTRVDILGPDGSESTVTVRA